MSIYANEIFTKELDDKASKDNGIDGIVIYTSSQDIFASSSFAKSNSMRGKNIDDEKVLSYMDNARSAKQEGDLLRTLPDTGSFQSDRTVYENCVWSVKCLETKKDNYYIVAWGYLKDSITLDTLEARHNSNFKLVVKRIKEEIEKYEQTI